MSVRAFLFPCCAWLTCLAAPATTTLTVTNQTGRTLAVTRLWSPWRPEPDDGPMAIPYFQRLIRPGAVATYRLQSPGKDLDFGVVVRHLPPDGIIDLEHMTIQGADDEGLPLVGERPAEPEAPAIQSKL